MRDGHLNKCKDCTIADVKRNYQATWKDRQAYEKRRSQEPKRREYQRRVSREYRLRNPEKYKAHGLVTRAILQGKLTREPCSVCGSPKSQAHHADYSKPLEVEWLCFRCHRAHAHGQRVE
jgi:hypothetical protein